MKQFSSLVTWLALSHLHSITLADEVDQPIHAIKLMSESPLIDTHVGLRQISRGLDFIGYDYGPNFLGVTEGKLNRLDVMFDPAHTSDQTMRYAIALSKLPSSGALQELRQCKISKEMYLIIFWGLIGDGPGKNPGIMWVLKGAMMGIRAVKDASEYPNLIVEILSRAWNDTEIYGVMGENLMRRMDEVDRMKEQSRDQLPSSAIVEKRIDLPATWGGQGQAYLPYEAQDIFNARVKHD